MEKSAILDGKKAWHPPLGRREQRGVKLDRLEFLCVRIYYILLPSSMADFVQCDQLVQKAHSPSTNLTIGRIDLAQGEFVLDEFLFRGESTVLSVV